MNAAVERLKQTSFYFDWPEFQSICIEQCNVRSVRVVDDIVVFKMEFALMPSHPEYRPKRGEHYGYREGSFTFEGVTDITWRDKTNQALKKRRSYTGKGIIMFFAHDPDGYLLYGDFGHLRVNCQDLKVALSPVA